MDELHVSLSELCSSKETRLLLLLLVVTGSGSLLEDIEVK